MAEELKPVCCGCGGEAEVVTAEGRFFVQCENCKIVTEAFQDIEKAITVWNEAMSGSEIEEKEGKWITHYYKYGKERYECDQCHETTDVKYDYCPHCGSKMWK